jgi:hypothetical protein
MTDQPTDTPLRDEVAGLDDARAVQVLALAMYRDQPPPPVDPGLEAHLQQAAQDTDPGEITVQPGVSDGELVRATLSYLVDADAERAADVQRAIDITSSGQTERFEPATLIIGGLVLLALKTEVKLDRNQDGRWQFHLHKKAMSDSAIGNLVGKLLGAYTPPPPGT